MIFTFDTFVFVHYNVKINKQKQEVAMAVKVTIQDIADALGVSRNTVSKAINNTGILADSTRDRVLKKAAEMGYKQFSYISVSDSTKPALSISSPKEKCEIALFTASFVGNSHFASPMLDKFQRELSQLGYSLTMHRIMADETDSLSAGFLHGGADRRYCLRRDV